MTSPPWLALLAPLPADRGECERTTMAGAPFDGWEQVRLVLEDGGNGMRVALALYDLQGRPGVVSDLVATAGGHHQETMGARVDPDGRMQGTGWRTEGDQHTPRALTDAEREGLRALADALRRRCPKGGERATAYEVRSTE